MQLEYENTFSLLYLLSIITRIFIYSLFWLLENLFEVFRISEIVSKNL